MRHQPCNVLLHSERPLYRAQVFGIRSISVPGEIKARTKSSTGAGQNHYSAFWIDRNVIKYLMKPLNELRRHGVQPLSAIQPNHDDSWDWSFEDDDRCW
jgi:hypothetical protein